MTRDTGSRLAAASGILAVVGLLALNSTDSAGSLVRGGELVALLLFVPFFAKLSSVLRAGDDSGWLAATALAAALIAVTIKSAGVIPVIVSDENATSVSAANALQRLGEVSFIVSLMPLGLSLGAIAALVVRSSALPAWLGWVAAVAAPLLVANSFDHGNDFGPAFILFLLWVLLTAAVLLRGAVALPRAATV